MAKGCERNFVNMTNQGYIISKSEIDIGLESKTFHTEEW
jgi:hypothetical protein